MGTGRVRAAACAWWVRTAAVARLRARTDAAGRPGTAGHVDLPILWARRTPGARREGLHRGVDLLPRAHVLVRGAPPVLDPAGRLEGDHRALPALPNAGRDVLICPIRPRWRVEEACPTS